MPEETIDEEQLLFEKLKKIEALFARTPYAGERRAAEEAMHRLRHRLKELEKTEWPVELRFSIADPWARSLFIALAQRYGLRPFRRAGQRQSTVMLNVAESFARDVLWPEFQEFYAVLRSHLDNVTQRIIQQAIHRDHQNIETKSTPAPAARPSEPMSRTFDFG
jgi:hypothetical protein